MKISDFTETVEVQTLLENMGITKIQVPPLQKYEFTRIKEKVELVTVRPPTGVLTFTENAKKTFIEIDKIKYPINIINDFIEIHGQKMCAYIKAQSSIRYGDSAYRYHICNCQTIKGMINQGRGSKYVLTAREDGYFHVLTYGSRGQRLVKLELCQHCIVILKEKGKYFTPFSLTEFYRRYQPDINQMFKREELVQHTTEYAPNHDEVAQAYKKQAEYKCQLCKVECSSNHSLLHLHHKDGDKHNNHHENLSVLCLLCHSEMYKHQHMKVPQYQIEEIRNLRTAQKILDLSEYSMRGIF